MNILLPLIIIIVMIAEGFFILRDMFDPRRHITVRHQTAPVNDINKEIADKLMDMKKDFEYAIEHIIICAEQRADSQVGNEEEANDSMNGLFNLKTSFTLLPKVLTELRALYKQYNNKEMDKHPRIRSLYKGILREVDKRLDEAINKMEMEISNCKTMISRNADDLEYINKTYRDAEEGCRNEYIDAINMVKTFPQEKFDGCLRAVSSLE